MYSVVVDARGRVFVGLDLGDTADESGAYRGMVAQVIESPVNGVAASLRPVIRGIRRPRQMAFDDSGNLFVVLEAEKKIIVCKPEDGSTSCATPETAVTLRGNSPPQGVAYRNGRLYWSEYGVYSDIANPVDGAIKSVAFPGCTVADTVVADLRGRGRGIGFDASGSLYVVTEANALDQGNTGALGKVGADGKFEVLVSGIDYPQFLAVAGDGGCVVPMARETVIGLISPNLRMNPLASANPAVSIVGSNLTSGAFAATDMTLTLEFPELGRRFSFSVQDASNEAPTYGWATFALANLSMTDSQMKSFTTEFAYPTPTVPGPGFYRSPTVLCRIGSKPCVAHVLPGRTQTRARWPMWYTSSGLEMPAAGFDETPNQWLVNFYW